MNSEQKHSRSSERFEKGLTTLLKKAYTPVEARSDFKQQLLDRLRDKQTVSAQARSARRRRSNVIFLTASGLAASLILSFGIAFNNPASQEEGQPVTSHNGNVMVFTNPPTALPHSNEKNETAVLAESTTPAATVATFGLIPEGWPGRLTGTVEVRDASGVWRTADSSIAFDKHSAIRIPAGKSGAIHLAPTVLLEMAGDSQLSLGNGELVIERGLMKFDIVPGSDPVHLTMQNKDIFLEGGSRLVLAQPGEKTTPNLVPGVVLVKGIGTMSDNDGARHAMRSGTAYRFDGEATRAARIPEVFRQRGETGENPVMASWLSPER